VQRFAKPIATVSWIYTLSARVEWFNALKETDMPYDTERVKAAAWAEYARATAPALADYERVKAAAWAEYARATAPNLAEYERVAASALDEYVCVTAAAWAEYARALSNRIAGGQIPDDGQVAAFADWIDQGPQC
jgi:cell division septum initiation protein DivIVA